jgi:hypothetical protein
MAYTVTHLITQAYYLSGIVARELQEATGKQLSDGLELLNALLAVKSIDGSKINYYTKYNFNAVVGQEIYFIPNLIDLETFTFFLNSIRYSMVKEYRKVYLGSPRANNITSLPFNWHHERVLNGSNLYVYFFPDQQYPMEIYGKFSLTQVALNQDLLLILDNFYIEYLRYELANYICGLYNIQFSAQNAAILGAYENQMKDIDPIDFSQIKMSYLRKKAGFSYADVNLGRGWRPGA